MKTNIPIQLARTKGLEYSEIQYWKKYYRPKAPLKSFASIIAGGMAFAVPSLPNLAMNRVVGLGLEQAITSEKLEAIISFYASVGVERFFIQLSPPALEADTQSLLREHDFRHYNNWTKYYREIKENHTSVNQKIEIVALDVKETALFGQIICTCFAWDYPGLDQWLDQSVGQEGYQHYAALLDGQVVAVAAMHVEGVFASMAFAATLPNYRELGIQQALLRRRIVDAQQLGCQYAVSETAEDRPDRPVTSARNMERQGFQIAYQRQNWIFES